jgi:hypothetical protein
MATPHVTPRPSHPQPFPKPQLFEAIAALNRDLGIVIDDLNRLREFRFSRRDIDSFVTKAERLKALANAELLERQLSRELKDDFHFSKLERKFQQRYRDPNDVLIDAQRRLEEMIVEEQDALAAARGIRHRRRRAEKKLAPLTAKPSK